MLVSDIDGTMIGEHGDAAQYASSRRFRDYWESGPALSGSILVFNTGRSVGAVSARDRGLCLCVMNVCVCVRACVCVYVCLMSRGT